MWSFFLPLYYQRGIDDHKPYYDYFLTLAESYEPLGSAMISHDENVG